MSKFCKKCGGILDENGFCSKCDGVNDNFVQTKPDENFRQASYQDNIDKPRYTQHENNRYEQNYENDERRAYNAHMNSRSGLDFDMNDRRINVSVDREKAKNFWVAWKNSVGFGDPATNNDNVYERNRQIVPDNVQPQNDEKPIHQYNFAVLRTRAQFKRAEARLQITTKRLIIRASGRSLIRGRTNLQYDFNINEIGGINYSKGYKFSFFNLLIALLLPSISFALLILLFVNVFMGEHMSFNDVFDIFELLNSNEITGMTEFFILFFGVIFMLPFFKFKNMWLFKLILTNFSINMFLALIPICIMKEQKFLAVLTIIVLLISVAAFVITLLVYILVPDMRFVIKSKDGTTALNFTSKKPWNFGAGFDEVIPTLETERAIEFINSFIGEAIK